MVNTHDLITIANAWYVALALLAIIMGLVLVFNQKTAKGMRRKR